MADLDFSDLQEAPKNNIPPTVPEKESGFDFSDLSDKQNMGTPRDKFNVPTMIGQLPPAPSTKKFAEDYLEGTLNSVSGLPGSLILGKGAPYIGKLLSRVYSKIKPGFESSAGKEKSAEKAVQDYEQASMEAEPAKPGI